MHRERWKTGRLPLRWLICLLLCITPAHAAEPPHYALTAADTALLEACEHREFDYFWNETDAGTGLIKDRASNSGRDDYTVASVAATGFGLAALAVGAERGWVGREVAAQRALTTLRFCRDRLPQEHGWFYHFVDVHSGRRVWQSEVSSIDTAFLVAGALVAAHYFKGTAVPPVADDIYRRVDFTWMLTNGGAKSNSKLLCHGWKPEQGFLKYRWDSYCEHMILYLLALGSPTHPIPTACWDAWARPQGEYKGHHTFSAGPLFEHQYSQAFVDFRGLRDRHGYDYWKSSVEATLANWQFCLDQQARFHTYAEHLWGLSACDGPDGYRAYGAPPGRVEQDGTVAPLAVVASVAFAPNWCLRTMHRMQDEYSTQMWGRYSFCDGVNVDRNWYDRDVIGIDAGCALLMIENYRSGLIWRLLEQDSAVRRGQEAAGFQHADEDAGEP